METEATLREWFERVDSEKTGNITAPQLKRALSVGYLDLSITVVQQMIRMYDFDRNGTMSFKEFEALNQYLYKVQQAFSDSERGHGFLVLDDVYKALVKIGFSLDSPAFYSVCESFDQTKNGRFQLDDFISLCIFLQSAGNLFNSFDTSKQGRVSSTVTCEVRDVTVEDPTSRHRLYQAVVPFLVPFFRLAQLPRFKSAFGCGMCGVADAATQCRCLCPSQIRHTRRFRFLELAFSRTCIASVTRPRGSVCGNEMLWIFPKF